jgi:hypothetical protein
MQKCIFRNKFQVVKAVVEKHVLLLGLCTLNVSNLRWYTT